MAQLCQTALDAPWAGKCAGENNGSTIDSIVLAKVARGRSSPRTTKNADWQLWKESDVHRTCPMHRVKIGAQNSVKTRELNTGEESRIELHSAM